MCDAIWQVSAALRWVSTRTYIHPLTVLTLKTSKYVWIKPVNWSFARTEWECRCTESAERKAELLQPDMRRDTQLQLTVGSSLRDRHDSDQHLLIHIVHNPINILHSRLRARCSNVVHDLGSAEPRSNVKQSSRWITLHQVELGSADPVQLNDRRYTVDDADWSTTLGLWVNYNDVTVTRNAYETVQ